MRIPDWSQEKQAIPKDLVDSILERRGGSLLNLDKALLWSEPVARGWNVYLKNVRTGLSTSRKLRELGICTVAVLTGATYEYHHHKPDYLAAGGTAEELEALNKVLASQPGSVVSDPSLGEIESVVIQYAAQMTLTVKVENSVFDKLKSHLNTQEIVELTTAIATYNMVARFLVALGVTPEV